MQKTKLDYIIVKITSGMACQCMWVRQAGYRTYSDWPQLSLQIKYLISSKASPKVGTVNIMFKYVHNIDSYRKFTLKSLMQCLLMQWRVVLPRVFLVPMTELVHHLKVHTYIVPQKQSCKSTSQKNK